MPCPGRSTTQRYWRQWCPNVSPLAGHLDSCSVLSCQRRFPRLDLWVGKSAFPEAEGSPQGSATGRDNRAEAHIFQDAFQPSPAVRWDDRVKRATGAHVGAWKVHVTPTEPSGSCRSVGFETETIR